MVARTRTSSSQHLGVAISTTEVCAVPAGGRAGASVRRIPIDPPPTEGAAWPSLGRAFAELQSTAAGARLSISLMPPLAEVRMVELPPLRDEEAERVLARGAARYFVNAKHAQLVGVVRGTGSRSGPRTAVAAAAPARLVAGIRAAATDAGLIVEGIGPAESAWAAAATAGWSQLSSDAAVVFVCHRDRTDMLRLENGRLSAVRRFRASTVDAQAMVDAAQESNGKRARVAVLGMAEERSSLVRGLAARGISPLSPDERGGSAREPELLAAEYAAPVGGPLFRTDDVRAAWRSDAWRATWLVAAAAVLLVVVGGGLKLWGVHRQLDAVRAERKQIAPRLSETLIGRTSVEAVSRNVSELNAVERTSPTWAQMIASVTDALPDSAYLTAFRTRGDSIIVEGLADQASDVFNALEQIPGLANVRAGAPVRRELDQDNNPLERFTIVARQPLSAGAPATTTAPRAGGAR